jgi:hypothetical protein
LSSLLDKIMKFCEVVCSGENLYGELVLDYECYWDCLNEFEDNAHSS